MFFGSLFGSEKFSGLSRNARQDLQYDTRCIPGNWKQGEKWFNHAYIAPFSPCSCPPPITSPWVSKDPKDYCKVKAHLTTRWPRGTGELTKCLFKSGDVTASVTGSGDNRKNVKKAESFSFKMVTEERV